MSYSRAHGDGLRLYIDAMNWLFSRGVSRAGEWTERNTGAWAYNAAAKDNKYTLIDMNPMKPCSFDTSANPAGHIMYQADLQVAAGMPIKQLAVMGHNAASAQACFRLAHNTSIISAVGAGSTVGTVATQPVSVLNGTVSPASGATLGEDINTVETVWTVSNGLLFTVGELLWVKEDANNEVVKVVSIATNDLTVTRAQQGTIAGEFQTGVIVKRYNVIQPTTDGDLILTFPEQDDQRYWAIEIIPSDGAFSTTDLEIGSIQIGDYHDFNIAPDLTVSHGFMQEGVKTRNTPAGRQITFAHHLSNNDSPESYAPFRFNDDYFRRMTGKEHWDMTWKGDDDTKIYPADISAPGSGSLVADFILKTSINFLPFILCTNTGSTDEGDYMWTKLDQSAFDTLQKAWQWTGFSLKFLQKF